MKNRSRTDIISQILEIAKGGTSKTRLMYGAYLSYTQLKEYLAALTKNGLVEFDRMEQKCRTTERGLKFLKAHTQMLSLGGEMKEISA